MTFILPAENVLSMHALAAAASFVFSTHFNSHIPSGSALLKGTLVAAV